MKRNERNKSSSGYPQQEKHDQTRELELVVLLSQLVASIGPLFPTKSTALPQPLKLARATNRPAEFRHTLEAVRRQSAFVQGETSIRGTGYRIAGRAGVRLESSINEKEVGRKSSTTKGSSIEARRNVLPRLVGQDFPSNPFFERLSKFIEVRSLLIVTKIIKAVGCFVSRDEKMIRL